MNFSFIIVYTHDSIAKDLIDIEEQLVNDRKSRRYSVVEAMN